MSGENAERKNAKTRRGAYLDAAGQASLHISVTAPPEVGLGRKQFWRARVAANGVTAKLWAPGTV